MLHPLPRDGVTPPSVLVIWGSPMIRGPVPWRSARGRSGGAVQVPRAAGFRMG